MAIQLKYHCKVCDYRCRQKSHIDSHKLTAGHLEKCAAMNADLKTNRVLFNKYITELNINDEDDKTMGMLRQEIIDKLSAVYGNGQSAEEQEAVTEVPRIVITERTSETQLSLIHELTQFTRGKTEQTLNKIVQRYLLNSISANAHIIQIIVTNKSLLETKQWKVRTGVKMEEFEHIRVDILSSDVKSDYHNINGFISEIMKAKTKNELPNILIVCSHRKRIDDLGDLFLMFSGNTMMIQNVKLKFNLTFDEPDANIGLCSKFLKKYKNYMHLIEALDFVTASPFKGFWDMLRENGIVQLTNPHNKEQESIDGKTYDEYLENYYQIKDHTHLICDHSTNNPLEYIEHVFASKYLVVNDRREPLFDIDGKQLEKPYIDMDESGRKIIFSPAHVYTEKEGVGSHEEVVQFYIEKKFTVFLSNGKYKGFIQPDGVRVSLDEFNLQHNITGELKDTMRKWAELNPDKNIATTGYFTIERGITFQTDGFNFTHAIISDYHKQSLNKLIQLIGRLTGNKQYITQKCNIICPQHIIDTVTTLVNKTVELRKENPENYNATDFSDKCSSIPVKLTFVNEEFRLRCIAAITGRRNYKQHLHALLKEGYLTGKITLDDHNNVYRFTKDKKNEPALFDDIHKSISNVKMYSLTDTSPQSRRFAQFNNAFNLYKPTSQTGEVGEYSIDLAKDRYEHNGFIHDVNIAWITFNHD